MAEDTPNPTKRVYPRFSPVQRFEHMVLLVTFSGLALTGLPQRYADQAWAQALIGLMGGIESIRIVHRVLATILMAEAIFHGGVITYKLFVLGRRATMLPGIRDLRDAIHWVLFNLGLRREHPHLPRYNFGEKAEYLAVVWGTLIMIITGYMLWNPISTSSVLPGEVIPAARAAHSAEALLAVLSIIIWHMYNVHIRRFNRSMFSGNISREAMEEEHAEELEAIERGDVPPELPADVIARRKRWFWPYAIVVTTILVTGLVLFITSEQTAVQLTTLPQRQTLVSTDIDSAIGVAQTGAALWQSLECHSCHGAQADGGDSPLGVPIAEREIDFEAFILAVRRGPAEMPAYSTARTSDEDIAHLWAWFQSLAPTASALDANVSNN
jgi:cytochrome b subunit of formate dehydrogenase